MRCCLNEDQPDVADSQKRSVKLMHDRIRYRSVVAGIPKLLRAPNESYARNVNTCKSDGKCSFQCSVGRVSTAQEPDLGRRRITGKGC